ncbi:MAG: CaiB/BaiF CoA-transferase family protein [Chloroflexi bacterium]|nr:CaiB/BaiF CoA-transferase family protein [Chloroflexota bacterium]
MTDDEAPLAGIRVIELASWVMAPAAAAVLAAYGADVIKIEPAGSGDPSRGSTVTVDGKAIEAGFELANNRKRSVHLDLATDAGREITHRLMAASDVFVTNVRARALERAGLSAAALAERYPRLIVAHATGYGTAGEDVDRPAFDELAYWSRGGIAATLRVDDGEPVGLVGAMGDLPSAISLVAGITTALFRRERTGRGAIVDVSLFQNGMWANGWMLQQALVGAAPRPHRGREHAFSPLYNSYRCRDGRWLQFAMLQPARFWAPLCAALDRDDLRTDERFARPAALLAHAREAIAELDGAIAGFELEDLGARLDARDLPWSPILELGDVVADEQARANGYIVAKQHRSGRTVETLAPPFALRGVALQFGPAPEAGQHTEAVLAEHGYSWEQIAELRERGAF